MPHRYANDRLKFPEIPDQLEKSVKVPKFKVGTEKWWLEDYFLFGKVTFQVLCWFQGGSLEPLHTFTAKSSVFSLILGKLWVLGLLFLPVVLLKKSVRS